MTDITGADRRLLEPLGTCSYAALRTLASCSFVLAGVRQCKTSGSTDSSTSSEDRARACLCVCAITNSIYRWR